MDLAQADQAGQSAQRPASLALVLCHECRSSGCGISRCTLCQHNPSRPCCRNAKPKYLEGDVLKAACESPLRINLMDRQTGACYTPGLPEGVTLEMHILNGERYQQYSEPLTTSQLRECIMGMGGLKRGRLLPLERRGAGDSQQRVQLALDNGVASLSDIALTCSSTAMLGGRDGCFKLLVWAVDAQAEPVPGIGYAVSEGFKVMTRRVKGGMKPPLPLETDPVTNLECVGKAIAGKLDNLAAALQEAGIQLPQLPPELHRVRTVGQCRALLQLVKGNRDLSNKLREALRVTPEGWEELCAHATTVLKNDSRRRVWWCNDGQLGLVYECDRGAVKLDHPAGVVTPDAPSSVLSLPAYRGWDELRKQLDTLKVQAQQAWRALGHPGWALLADSPAFVSPLDSAHQVHQASGGQQAQFTSEATPSRSSSANPPPDNTTSMGPPVSLLTSLMGQVGPNPFNAKRQKTRALEEGEGVGPGEAPLVAVPDDDEDDCLASDMNTVDMLEAMSGPSCMEWHEGEGNPPPLQAIGGGSLMTSDSLLLQHSIKGDVAMQQGQQDGATPWDLARSRGRKEVMEVLQAHNGTGSGARAAAAAGAGGGNDTHKASLVPVSPLHAACYGGHLPVVEVLLRFGAVAALDSVDGASRTALWHACNNGHADVVTRLLQAGADASLADQLGAAPLHAVCCHSSQGHLQTAGVLLAHRHARDAVAAEDTRGQTPLLVAAQRGQCAMVELLLKAQSSIEAEDRMGRTALWLAGFYGHLDVVRCLLDRGADVSCADKDGRSPLGAACADGDLELCKLLLGDKGGEVAKNLLKATDKFGRSLLHLACSSGNSEVVALLLGEQYWPAFDGCVDVRDNDGWTALHHAAASGSAGAVKALLAKLADEAATSNDGVTPWDLARSRGRKEVMEVLQAHNGTGSGARAAAAAGAGGGNDTHKSQL